jgi:hypothetical protein
MNVEASFRCPPAGVARATNVVGQPDTSRKVAGPHFPRSLGHSQSAGPRVHRTCCDGVRSCLEGLLPLPVALVTGNVTEGRKRMTDDLWAQAAETLDGIRRVAAGLGMTYSNLGPTLFGAGFGVAHGDESFCVVSVHAGIRWYVRITSAILRNVRRAERPAIVDALNTMNTQLPTCRHFLHVAEAGSDILVGIAFLDEVFLQIPKLFKMYTEAIPQIAQKSREQYQPLFGGSAYRWNTEDANELLLRSLA